MREFVLEQRILPITWNEYGTIVENYANFLSQPLEIWMFVPCDEDGNVLEDPGLMPSYELNKYREAKDRVLFEGFTIEKQKKDEILFIDKNGYLFSYMTISKTFYFHNDDEIMLLEKIEDLVDLKLKITADLKAIKQLLNN